MRGWNTVALGEIAESVEYGVTASATQEPRGPKFLRITDIQNGRVDWNTVPWCECDSRSRRNALIKPGDIVFARTGATTGKSFLIRECPDDAVFASYLIRLRVGSGIEPRYISHFFQTPDYWSQITTTARGAAQPGVNATTLKSLAIPLPSLPEQRRIAEVLDRAEALRANRRAALAQLDELPRAIFSDMFGNPATNPKKWPEVSFGVVGKNEDSRRVPVKAEDRHDRRGEYPYYGASGVIDWIDDYIFDGERLLIGEDGANLLMRNTPVAFIAEGKFWVNNHAHVIAANERADLRFLECFLEQVNLEPFISGTAQPKLNRANLDRIPLPLPPIHLQREFARHISAVERMKAAQRASLTQLDALFATLQHRAFRGEL